MAIDHYAILGLAYGATHEEIKKAHRKLALRFVLHLFPARVARAR
jgi:curved DNA-binding protein CbpA